MLGPVWPRFGLKGGLDFHILTERHGYNGIATLDEAREGIASAIRKSDRPVLIISQSKGSVAVLSALLAHPELAARVDHGDTTMTTSSFDRISFTYAILALMLGL